MEKLHKEADEVSQFLVVLHEFHRKRGTDFKFPPKICGQEIDLHHLYKAVTGHGGASKVNDKQKWHEIRTAIEFPEQCPNSTLVLRQIYQRYLGAYEKVTFLGEDPDAENGDTAGDASSSFRGSRSSTRGGGASASAIVVQVPMSYNKTQHEVSDTQRQHFGLSTTFAPPPSPYERLCYSLQSGLPNEETFALNVCTLLANGGRHTLQLNRAPSRLIDLLISQAGVPADDITLKESLEESWQSCEARRMTRFWQEHVDPCVGMCFGITPLERYAKIVDENKKDTIDLIAEGSFMASKNSSSELFEDELFNLDNEISPRDAEAQRALRIALIFHNLSFEDANAQILAGNQGFLRFMMLCSLCRWSSLRQVALDCLSNIASQLLLNVHDDLCCRSLLRLSVDGILKSEDRALVTRCLDIIAHLAQCESNAETLVAELEVNVFERLFELLTVHDVMLIIYSLEAIYALSELGSGICDRLANIHQAISVLVGLLSLDPLAYGPSAQRGMRVVEHFDPSLPPSISSVNHHMVGTAVHSTPVPVSNHMRLHTAVASPATPASNVHVVHPPAAATPPSIAAAEPATEIENLACAWIRASYELCPGSSVSRNDIYAEYVTYCSKLGKRSVLTAVHFGNCVKNMYPQCVLKIISTQTTSANGIVATTSQTCQMENIRRRPTPLPIQIGVQAQATVANQLSATAMATPVPSATTPRMSTPQTPVTPGSGVEPNQSPAVSTSQSATPSGGGFASILKAQLSAPLKPAGPQTGGASSATEVPSGDSSVSGQGAAGGSNSSNSSLIKCLLANKVSRNMQKQAALGAPVGPVVGKAALPNEGAASPAAVVVQTKPSLPTASVMDKPVHNNPTTPASQNHIHMNGQTDDSKKDGAIRSNGTHNNSQDKIYKSSPLLNGLLDRGTKGVVCNGDVDQSQQQQQQQQQQPSIPNGAPTNAANPRKRKLTFSEDSNDSTKAPQLQEKESSLVMKNSTLSKLLNNGSVTDESITNNNDAKKIKLDDKVQHINGDKPSEENVVSSTKVEDGSIEGAKETNEKPAENKVNESKKEEKKVLRYFCEWKGCAESFTNPKAVFAHAVRAHVSLRGNVDAAAESLVCQWGAQGDKDTCDGMQRRRLSLCTHIQERHCNDQMLQIQAIRRQQISQFGSASIPPPPQPPAHPGYSPDAAMLAIRRHSLSFYQYKDAADEKELPVTRSVRLTAALILRNLARHAPDCRKRLLMYEHRLANIAMSNLEASRTIAQCLTDMHAPTTPFAASTTSSSTTTTATVTVATSSNSLKVASKC